MKYYLFAALALSAFSLTSCLKTQADTCEVILTTPIVKAVGPKTIAVNQPATYLLDYLPGTGCGVFDALSEQGQSPANTNTRTINVTVRYSTCNCAVPATPLQTTYNFVPTQAGTYYLKFVANNGYLIDTLVAK
ncbi:hypothetical protein QMK33_16955 [Hymenobacter sp. H14-R3]|uniref:hypothetical protein n=1 Tax=Hymenobacter sp. H14-R3 TaxID=3046308 RepID=UPI0024B8BDB2|nr:hypothetical protein [Hymenobacter sp. H14-R3]MDJ0366844.1 hypothetical protein [Hymenobacter sp. H14-R3]